MSTASTTATAATGPGPVQGPAAPLRLADAPPLAPVPAAPGRLLTGTLLASSTLTIMAAAIIAPSLPEMQRVFSGVPAADLLVRLMLTITSLTIGITAALVGGVSDRVGRKPVLISSLVLYAVAGTAGWFLSDLYLLLGARALLGVAVGGITTSVSALITDWFDGPRRAAFLGRQAAFASLGGVVFLPLSGVLAGVTWNAPFWVYAVAILVVPFAVAGVREARSPTATTSADGSAVSDGVDRHPRVTRALALVYVVAWAGTLIFFMAPTQLPFLLQQFDASTTMVGVAVAGSTASSALAAVGYARVRRVLSQEQVTALSLALLGAGWLVIGVAGSLPLVVLGTLIGGLGVGLVIPNLNLVVAGLVPAARRGRALGGLVSAIFLGQFASPLLLQPVVAALGTGGAFLATGAAAGLGAAALTIARGRLPRGSAVRP